MDDRNLTCKMSQMPNIHKILLFCHSDHRCRIHLVNAQNKFGQKKNIETQKLDKIVHRKCVFFVKKATFCARFKQKKK